MKFAEAALQFEKASLTYAHRDQESYALCLFRLANMYVRGYGVTVTTHEGQNAADLQAYEYLIQAAQHGCPRSQHLLGRLKVLGRASCGDRSKDFEQGLTLLNFAAAMGHVSAQYSLALIHDEGLGIDVSTAEARKQSLLRAQELYGDASTNEKVTDKIKTRCEKRMELIAKLLQRQDVLDAPWYYLSEGIFRERMRTGLQGPALQMSVHSFLTQFAQKERRHYEPDMETNRSFEISELLLDRQLRLDEMVIDLERIAGDDEKKHDTDMQIMTRKMRIKQCLKHWDKTEDEEDWETEDVDLLVAAMEDHVTAVEELIEPFNGGVPVEHVETALNKMCGAPKVASPELTIKEGGNTDITIQCGLTPTGPFRCLSCLHTVDSRGPPTAAVSRTVWMRCIRFRRWKLGFQRILSSAVDRHSTSKPACRSLKISCPRTQS